MQKIIKVFVSILLIKTLYIYIYSAREENKQPRYLQESYRLKAKIIESLQAKWNLKLIGIGGGAMENIQLINLVFNAYDCQPKNLTEARALIVECAEISLGLLNRDEKIRPYLPISRMQGENLNLQLIFEDAEKTERANGDFYAISLYDGEVRYRVFPEGDLIHCESYPKALKIMQAQKTASTIYTERK